ncbi:MAG TPA: DNA polymerase Y family protein [Polyangiaceae bacterium]
MAQRRVAAIFLPELYCELVVAGSTARAEPPFGVILAGSPESSSATPAATERLVAVNHVARRYGVRAGQSIAEAGALVARLEIHRVAPAAIDRALAAVADVAFAFGATVAVRTPDTVFVELGGSSHLFGGEEALGEELAGRVRALGHGVRIAVADGPELARAFACWGAPAGKGKAVRCVPSEHTAQEARTLPVVALPLSDECQGFLVRLGVLTFGDLAGLPRSAVGGRLEGEVSRALDLAAGVDRTPLVPYQPASELEERVSFEHGVAGSEPLLFALRGLASRLSARLSGRGEAADALVLTVQHDRSIARLRGVKPETKLRFSLATPLHREEDVRRIVFTRLERVRLPAPSVGLVLAAPVLVSAVQRQLELGEALAGNAGASDELPLVLAELRSDLGEERVGILKTLDAHRLEAQSVLEPTEGVIPGKTRGKARRAARSAKRSRQRETPLAVHVSGASSGELVGGLAGGAPVTRLLPEPLPLDAAFRVGATVAIDHRLYNIERLRFEQRLYAVEWWTRAPVQRDYVRLWLRGHDGVVEALAFVDRESQKRYLQAVAD